MAKRKRATTQKSIEKWIKEGRGQGRGATYKPWLRIQDVPSRGLAHRIKGQKTGRVHHFLSQFEAHFFYTLEWLPQVTDIREQYPLLPLDETMEIARECGFRHPTDPRSKYPVVMTTDFLITLQGGSEQPRTLKMIAELGRKRVMEKLEIERRYWECRHLELKIITNAGIPGSLTRNVELLHSYYNISDRLEVTKEQLRLIIATLNTLITQDEEQTLRAVAAQCDLQTGVEPGVSLTVIYHLLATRQWEVDIRKAIDPDQPLVILAVFGQKKEAKPCN